MATMTNEFRNYSVKPTQEIAQNTEGHHLTIANEPGLIIVTLIKTLIEIIKITNYYNMDKETREQFPTIAKEIIQLAEKTQ